MNKSINQSIILHVEDLPIPTGSVAARIQPVQIYSNRLSSRFEDSEDSVESERRQPNESLLELPGTDRTGRKKQLDSYDAY
jgi:hypothetical protein